MRELALPAIAFYQRHLSPYKGFACAYRVHIGACGCSELGYRAIRRFGVFTGLGVLRQRLALCGVAHRRFASVASAGAQRGSAPCDLPCDFGSDSNCDLDCCDACSCDGPDRRKKRANESSIHLPPRRGRKTGP